MVLGSDGRILPLRVTQLPNIEPSQRCVDIHETTVGSVRGRSLRRGHPRPKRCQTLETALRARDIPSPIEARQHLAPVLGVQLLYAKGQSHLGITRSQALHRLGKSRRARRTGIFNIDDGQAAEAVFQQGQLAPDTVLAIHVALHAVSKIGDMQVAPVQRSVLQDLGDRLARQIVHTALGHATERCH
jgi:hypothetical protein